MSQAAIEGLDELSEAVHSIGLAVEDPPADHGADLILVNPAGGQVAVQVKRSSLAAADGLERKIDRWSGERRLGTGVRVLVADRVTDEARSVLQAAGWGWLDLRGHLHIAAPGLFIDSEVRSARRAAASSNPLGGSVGVEVAALLLLEPGERMSVRHLARVLGRSPSSVSAVLTGMAGAGLVDEQRRPVVPDLFWELAEHWKPLAMDVASVPRLEDHAVSTALGLGLDCDIASTTGWALTDATAAARYGAPVGLRADHPPDFFVPDRTTQRRAVRMLGAVDDHARRGARIKVAPVPLICADRLKARAGPWPLARPLFVALDLAQDHGRGREVLAGWTPDDEGHRVW
jgi:hypothetical protein